MRTLILSFCVAVFCLQLELSAAAKICGRVSGYDVDLLSRGDYWFVTETTNQRKCFKSSDTEMEDIAYCDFYYSFCHALPDHICPDITRTADVKPSVCQKVYYNDGSSIEYDMGKFSTEHEFHPANTTSFDGFETTWMGESVTTVGCSGNTTMIVSFKCDRNSVWERGNPNVNKYLDILLKVDCVYVVQVNYEGACYQTPTVAPGNCQLDPYDITTLSDKLYWTATLPKDACVGRGATCSIVFSFCHALPPNISETCNGASVCQLATTGGESKSYSMGKFENYTQFQQNDDKKQPGFHVSWDNGSYTQDCLEGLTTEMIFICRKSANWTTEDQTTNLAHVYFSGSCVYVLEFNYNGACDIVVPTPSHSHADTLQICWILVGIFVPLSVIVLVVIIILASVLVGCWWMRRPRQLQSGGREPLLSEAAVDEEDSLNDDDTPAVDLEPQHKPSQA